MCSLQDYHECWSVFVSVCSLCVTYVARLLNNIEYPFFMTYNMFQVVSLFVILLSSIHEYEMTVTSCTKH